MAKTARGGRKHRLLLYHRLVGRWWTPFLAIGLVLLFYVGLIWGAEWYFIDPADNPLIRLTEFEGIVLLAVGGLSILFSLFLVTVRNFAYIQLFGDHFRIVTPFLRLKISYKRIHQVTSNEFSALYPPSKLSSWKREMLEPLLGRTANVIHLNKLPVSRFWLRLFLSPYFFYDKTPHFVIIVDDWMRLSTELDSARVSGRVQTQNKPKAKQKLTPGLLDDLNKHFD